MLLLRLPNAGAIALMIFTGVLDKSAIGLSMFCILHCLALPFVVIMVPQLTAYWFAGEDFHLTLIYLVLPTSVLAIGLGCRRHGSYQVMAWGLIGLLTLVLAAVYGHDVFGEMAEKLLTLMGGIFVMIAHFLNFRLCQSCDCEH
ncbi:MAG: MerC family mercury resistance protein [Proteobacteria bacterium]|nr:MerC family mercury resistance protein [Pseudomonadota bacterium]